MQYINLNTRPTTVSSPSMPLGVCCNYNGQNASFFIGSCGLNTRTNEQTILPIQLFFNMLKHTENQGKSIPEQKTLMSDQCVPKCHLKCYINYIHQ